MNPSQPETRPGESFRRLVLRLPIPTVPDGATPSFDVESFAATLKRSRVEVVTLVASDSLSDPADTSNNASEPRIGDFRNRLMAACRNQGLTVEVATSTGQEARLSLAAFANRPTLEAACYARVCRGRPLALEDCLDPTGTFDAEAYRLLNGIFDEIAFKERWCRGAQTLVEIGIVSAASASESSCGAARIVQAGGHAFDLPATSADFTPYRVLILPEDVPLESALRAKLQAHLQRGGKMLAAFESGSDAEQSGLAPNADSGETDTKAVALRNGNTVLLSEPHLRAYAHSAGTRHRRTVLEALNLLLPDPLLRHDGPGTLEAIVTEQEEQNRWVLHLLHYLPMSFALDSPMRDDILPVHEVKISLKTPKPVARIHIRPQHHDELDFWEHQGRVEFVVPKITGHRMVSIEFAKEGVE